MGKTKAHLCIQKVSSALPFILITAVILIPIGITLMTLSSTVNVDENIVDYTYCQKANFEGSINKTCIESMRETNKSCICYHTFNISMDMKGDINIYYELDTYDQLNSDYVNSRDDNQLMGILTDMPSANCEPYRYVETEEGKIPIAPCGAIADSMFTDQFILNDGAKTSVPFLYSGILADNDKTGYKNPPGNLTAALQKFGKPKRWDRNIWELDISNPDNNSFQNEKFIGWMKTDMKRKPYARVDKKYPYGEGLHSGEYVLRINYNYPLTLYDGRRKFILSASQKIWRSHFFIVGLSLLVVGVILFAFAIIWFIMQKTINAKEDTSRNNVDDANVSLRRS